MDDAVDLLADGRRRRIGIIDADLIDHGTRHPNLALMKISGYLKERGHSVNLVLDYSEIDDFDFLFLSCVFSFTKVDEALLKRDNIVYGGTGIFVEDGGPDLPNAIEHHMPDYALYDPYVARQEALGRRRSSYEDYVDYSIGFTTRGCFRKCSFCVNRKYSYAFRHSAVSEFLDESRPYIYLWDDNFLAFSGWEQILDELDATGKPFQFRQGLDIRLMTNAKAKKLAHCRYHGDFIFAFDHLEDRDAIERGLRIWRRWTSRGTRLYVLSGYESQDERDIRSVFERIRILMKYECLPYIMRYESYKQSKLRALYVTIARWCNQPQFFKKMSFREFCEANQRYHKRPDSLCTAMRAMTDFESQFPDIAREYFDLKFEEVSMLRWYGRQFASVPSEDTSCRQKEAWLSFKTGEYSNESALLGYYSKNLDIVWKERDASRLSIDSSSDDAHGVSVSDLGEEAFAEVDRLFSLLRSSSISEILNAVLKIERLEPITQANIPQFSSIELAKEVPSILHIDEEGISYEQLGAYLGDDNFNKKMTANKKLGENHAKLATLLDLANITSKDRKLLVYPTRFGELFLRLPAKEQDLMLAKLVLRIPVIQHILCDAATKGEVHVSEYLVLLANSTRTRRLPNIMRLLELIENACEPSDSTMRKLLAKVSR